MGKYRIQHYVPQFYLRAFSSTPDLAPKKQKIFRHRLDNEKTDEPRIEKTAQKHWFYSYRGERTLNEQALSRWENRLAPSLKKIQRDILSDTNPFSDRSSQIALAFFVRLQLLRTPAARQVVTEREAEWKDLPPGEGQTPEAMPRSAPELLVSLIFDRERCRQDVNLLLSGIWILWTTSFSEIPFITSDCPVVSSRHPAIQYEESPETLLDYGVEHQIPLSPGLLLSIHERGSAPEIVMADRTIIAATEQKVRELNRLQLRSRSKELYSHQSDFTHATQTPTG